MPPRLWTWPNASALAFSLFSAGLAEPQRTATAKAFGQLRTHKNCLRLAINDLLHVGESASHCAALDLVKSGARSAAIDLEQPLSTRFGDRASRSNRPPGMPRKPPAFTPGALVSASNRLGFFAPIGRLSGGASSWVWTCPNTSALAYCSRFLQAWRSRSEPACAPLPIHDLLHVGESPGRPGALIRASN